MKNKSSECCENQFNWPHNYRKSIYEKALITLFSLLSLAWVLSFLLTTHRVGCDFRWRYNEICCVRTGLDPYQVWSRNIISRDWHPYNHPELKRNPKSKPVNAYPPWEYTLLAPLTVFPLKTAWQIYRSGECCALLIIVLWAFLQGMNIRHDFWDGLFCSAASLSCGIASSGIWATDNFGIYLSLALIILIHGLRTKRLMPMSLALVVLMVKPQIGTLVAVALLIARKWRPVLMAGVLCFAATLWPSHLLHVSPISLVLQIPKYGSDVIHNTLLFPEPVFRFMTKLIGQFATMAVNMFLGLAICSFWTHRVRNAHDPAFSLLPAILCNVLWTYSSPHDRFIWSIAQVMLALLIVKEESLKRRLFLLAIMSCLIASGLMIFHVKCEGGWPASLGWNTLGGRYGQVLFFLSYILLPLAGIFGALIQTAFAANTATCLRSTPPPPTA